MRTTFITVGLLLALSACSSQDSAAPNTPPSSAPGTTGPQSSPAQQSTPDSDDQDKSDLPNGTDVNCSTTGSGKVDTKDGKQVDLIAEATSTGTVGCAPALGVINDYFRDAPTKAKGDTHELIVQGWRCRLNPDNPVVGVIACDLDGLQFHTSRS